MSSSRLIVGCPVKDRAWILPEWHQRVVDSCFGFDPEFLFVCETGDNETLEIAYEYGDVVLVEDAGFTSSHNWGDHSHLRHMVDLRNTLLKEVRSREPDLFWSLDSDILIPKPLFNNLRSTISKVHKHGVKPDAVGGFTFMDGTDQRVTSFANLKNNRVFKRVLNPGVHEVDYIMAIKLMTPNAYNVDYSFSKHGEDIAWCDSAREIGLKLFCDGRSIAKHVMNKSMIDKVDKRVGF